MLLSQENEKIGYFQKGMITFSVLVADSEFGRTLSRSGAGLLM